MTSAEKPISILIADDHLIVREGLRLIFETTDGIDLIGEAADGAEAVRQTEHLNPQVVLMDLRMPGMDGLTAIQRLQELGHPAAIIILTTFDEDDLMLRGLRAGAKGFLLKDTDRETLVSAIHAAARGETLLTTDLLTRLLSHTERPATVPTKHGPLDLTDRELEVLVAAARGERNKEIARRLGITERTVKAHLTSIYNKFGVDSRAAAIGLAAQRGLLPDVL
jgi:two-component system, NarL family, response regulator YdfI